MHTSLDLRYKKRR